MSKHSTTAFVLILISLGYFATDIYLPSLPALTTYFNTSENSVQMTLFSYMISFAFAPLLFGPLSDHIGRKKVIFLGIVIGLFATIGCLFANDINTMIAFRFIQGIGAGAVLISARTTVSDLFIGVDLAKQISYITMFMPLALALAPTIGGILQETYGWHSVFIFLACYMALVLAWVSIRPETLKNSHERKFSEIFSNYSLHAKNKPFIYQTLFIFPTFGMYAYLTTSPFLFQDVIGLSPIQYGTLALYVGATIMISSYINSKLIHRFSLSTLMMVCGILTLTSGLLLLMFHLMGILTTWSLLIPSLLFFTCVPLGVANSGSKAMGLIKIHFGSANAILTTLQFLAGAFASYLFTLVTDNSALPLALCFITLGILTIVHQSFSKKIL